MAMQLSLQQAGVSGRLAVTPRPSVCSTSWRARTAVHASSASSSTSSLSSGLGLLQQTQPVDRLRYQARLVFDRLDSDGDGLLTAQDLDAYGRFCSERLGTAAPGLLEPLAAAAAAYGPSGGLLFDQFASILRAQVRAMSGEPGRQLLDSKLGGPETGRLLMKSCVSPPELAAALLVFSLLDGDSDGKLRLEELRRAQGIEKKVVEDVLEDADVDDDGLLSFEDFLTSYHKERPVVQNMVVLLAHTCFFWVVLNLEFLDMPFKALLVALALLKPQLITNPILKIYNIAKAIWDRLRAGRELGM